MIRNFVEDALLQPNVGEMPLLVDPYILDLKSGGTTR